MENKGKLMSNVAVKKRIDFVKVVKNKLIMNNGF